MFSPSPPAAISLSRRNPHHSCHRPQLRRRCRVLRKPTAVPIQMCWSRISPWLKTVRWTPFRILQTLIAVLVLLTMRVQMFSGITLSKYVFSFIHIDGLTSVARMMHMLGVYWGFVLISLHLGLHRHLVISKMKIKLKKSSKAKQMMFAFPSFILAAYGIYAFISRGLADYMFLKNQFVFFDFTKPLILFFIDYLAIMALFVFVGYYCSKLIMRLPSA